MNLLDYRDVVTTQKVSICAVPFYLQQSPAKKTLLPPFSKQHEDSEEGYGI